MNADDFKTWLGHHRAAFVGLSEWFKRLPKEPTEDPTEPIVAEVLQAWRNILRDVELEDAIAATDAMARGDEPTPDFASDHPRAVRRIAHGLGRLRAAQTRLRGLSPRETTVRCLTCMDSGTVRIWHARSIRAALEGSVGVAGTLYSCAVACTCPAGDTMARTISAIRGGDPSRWRFDANAMLPAPLSLTEPGALEDLKAYAQLRHDEFVDSLRYHEFNQFAGNESWRSS